MSKLEIKRVVSKSDLKEFVKFPIRLYSKNRFFVPPLILDEINTLSKKNPAFEYCEAEYWLAKINGKTVGRIAGIINHRYIAIWGYRLARFGWLDFIDDKEVVDSLFATVEEWAKSKGMEGLHGPLGFTDLDREGMLVEGFEEVGTFATIYNYPYYPTHLERLGYKKDVDWVEYHIKVPDTIPERATQIANLIAERKNIRVVEAKQSKDLLPYAKGLFEVINEAYNGLYGFVPLTDKQVALYTKQYFPLVSPDFLKILVDSTDRVIGFVISMPSISRALQKSRGKLFPFGFLRILINLRKPKKLDLYLGAIRKEYQGRGANALLMTELTKSCIRRGIVDAESNPELETNLPVQGFWRYFDSRQHKRRRCFIKHF